MQTVVSTSFKKVTTLI